MSSICSRFGPDRFSQMLRHGHFHLLNQLASHHHAKNSHQNECSIPHTDSLNSLKLWRRQHCQVLKELCTFLSGEPFYTVQIAQPIPKLKCNCCSLFSQIFFLKMNPAPQNACIPSEALHTYRQLSQFLQRQLAFLFYCLSLKTECTLQNLFAAALFHLIAAISNVLFFLFFPFFLLQVAFTKPQVSLITLLHSPREGKMKYCIRIKLHCIYSILPGNFVCVYYVVVLEPVQPCFRITFKARQG